MSVIADIRYTVQWNYKITILIDKFSSVRKTIHDLIDDTRSFVVDVNLTQTTTILRFLHSSTYSSRVWISNPARSILNFKYLSLTQYYKSRIPTFLLWLVQCRRLPWKTIHHHHHHHIYTIIYSVIANDFKSQNIERWFDTKSEHQNTEIEYIILWLAKKQKIPKLSPKTSSEIQKTRWFENFRW